MKDDDLVSMSSEDIVEEFIRVGLQMYEANEDEDIDEFNKQYYYMRSLRAELISRPGDHRRLLLPLLTHKNPQLRLTVIESTLAIEPVAARVALEELANSRYAPYDSEAKSTIRYLDTGFWVPD